MVEYWIIDLDSSQPYFTPIHLQPFYVNKFGYRRGDFPVTEDAGDTCLALPSVIRGVMTEEQVAVVCGVLEACSQSSNGELSPCTFLCHLPT